MGGEIRQYSTFTVGLYSIYNMYIKDSTGLEIIHAIFQNIVGNKRLLNIPEFRNSLIRPTFVIGIFYTLTLGMLD